MNMNIHNAKSVELVPASELSTGTWVRELIITLESGERFRLNVFADDRDNLLIKG